MSGSSVDRAVDTMSRLAQWRIDDLGSFNYHKGNTFKLGPWNWHLSVDKERLLIVKFYAENSVFTEECPPMASFIIRVVSLAGGCRKTLTHSGITDKQFKSSDDFFFWEVDVPLTGSLVIDVEFLDLKTTFSRGDGPCSIWANGLAQKTSNKTALSVLAKMLEEGIHTDIIINASDGSIGAHRAVLASQSPVFRGMFLHLKEKELSKIDISEMSIMACKTFLNYIYGSIQHEDFLTRRLSLLHAADMYDISELKEACQESLLEDINLTNVLDRLRYASLYQLPKLKTGCMTYLVKFGKIFDIRDEFASFVHTANRELVAEIFNEVLNAWGEF